jgi:L-threonylcarbamoyladenylate synthase
MTIQRTAQMDSCRPQESFIDEAAKFLLEGKIVVYPTDTIYALGVNALDPDAIKSLFKVKERSLEKPIHVVVDSLEMAEKYVILNKAARQLAARFLPGPLTLILPKRAVVPDLLVGGRETLGIRIPNNKVCLRLVQKAGVPLTATGANISGGGNLYTVDEVVKQLGQHIDEVALFIDQGPLEPKPPSTLIDLSTSPPAILREGPITRSELWEALGEHS